MRFSGQHIWIIGASSGIGKELALTLAKQGATLFLSSRNEASLLALQQQLSGTHFLYPMDVAELSQIQNAAHAIIHQHKTIDRVIFLAALYQPQTIAAMDPDFCRTLIATNVLGGIYTSITMLPLFHKQQYGQIALCASCAGYVGLPGGQPYSASKAALINFAESLAAESPDYIDVKLINPGFVRTPLTDKNSFPMPFRIEADKAAEIILHHLDKRRFEITFPKRFTYILKFLSILPYWIKLWLIKKIPIS